MKIPTVGLGTWKIPKAVTADLVFSALKIGARHLDCACDYGNEVEVGKGLARAISEGIVQREDVFITSKLWNTFHHPDHVELAARKSLSDLGIDYFDLYLIHFPIAQRFVPIETRYPPEWIHDPDGINPKMELVDIPYSATWAAMEDLHTKGIAKHIGVCNLNVQAIMQLLSYAKVAPAANQIELHPYLVQQPLVDYCQSRGIAVVGFSPLGSPSYIELNMDSGLGVGVLDEPAVMKIAMHYNKTPAQVVLRWNTQRGVVVIPKSKSIERIAENLNILDFSLSADELTAISALDRKKRFNDPGEFCKGMGGAVPIYD